MFCSFFPPHQLPTPARKQSRHLPNWKHLQQELPVGEGRLRWFCQPHVQQAFLPHIQSHQDGPFEQQQPFFLALGTKEKEQRQHKNLESQLCVLFSENVSSLGMSDDDPLASDVGQHVDAVFSSEGSRRLLVAVLCTELHGRAGEQRVGQVEIHRGRSHHHVDTAASVAQTRHQLVQQLRNTRLAAHHLVIATHKRTHRRKIKPSQTRWKYRYLCFLQMRPNPTFRVFIFFFFLSLCFSTCRILQQLSVNFSTRQNNVTNHRTTNKAILHTHHVRKLFLVFHANFRQLDVQILINRMKNALFA